MVTAVGGIGGENSQGGKTTSEEKICFRASPRLCFAAFVAFQDSDLVQIRLSLSCTHLTTSTDNQGIFFSAPLERELKFNI